ncbi:MAG: hypothetical protein ACRDKI_10910 [Solirubrobacterales bacterium]
MNEKHFAEIEKSLLNVSATREKLREAAKAILADGAEPHLVEALNEADREIEKVYKKLFQDTYFHVPEDEPRLFKSADARRTLSQ